MRKILSLIISLTLMICVYPIFNKPLHAQSDTNLTFDQAMQIYVQSYQPYDASRKEYTVARSQYLKFRTLKSRNDARDATLKMLELRDAIVINYLTALLLSVKENPGLNDTDKDLLSIRINEYLNWFTEHKSKLPSADTPEDLARDSDAAKAKFKDMAIFIDQVRARTAYGLMADIDKRIVENFSSLKSKLDQIKNDTREGYSVSSQKQQTIDKWVNESDNRLVRFDGKLTEAEGKIISITDKLNTNLYAKVNYDSVFIVLQEAQSYLDGALSFMQEVIREVKTADK